MVNTQLPPHSQSHSQTLAAWLAAHPRVLAITGAGVSTVAGIPDYRDESGAWKRPAPITYQAFRQPAAYQRYWARSTVGWRTFSRAQPTAAHVALAALERAGRLSLLVTQNVDGLHQRAGSRNVLDLHGRLDAVVCLQCHTRQSRSALQQRLDADNPHWLAEAIRHAPDGDADIPDESVASFTPPFCPHCGGQLKPDVVFFGENVPPDRPVRILQALEQSDAVLVIGSSLMVHSGWRHVQAAHSRGLPLAILNQGQTRADALASLRIHAEAGQTLQAAIALLTRPTAEPELPHNTADEP